MSQFDDSLTALADTVAAVQGRTGVTYQARDTNGVASGDAVAIPDAVVTHLTDEAFQDTDRRVFNRGIEVHIRTAVVASLSEGDTLAYDGSEWFILAPREEAGSWIMLAGLWETTHTHGEIYRPDRRTSARRSLA